MTWLRYYRDRLYSAILNAVVLGTYQALAGMDERK